MFKMMNIAIIFAILVCYGDHELVYPQDICYLRVPMGVDKKRAILAGNGLFNNEQVRKLGDYGAVGGRGNRKGSEKAKQAKVAELLTSLYELMDQYEATFTYKAVVAPGEVQESYTLADLERQDLAQKKKLAKALAIDKSVKKLLKAKELGVILATHEELLDRLKSTIQDNAQFGPTEEESVLNHFCELLADAAETAEVKEIKSRAARALGREPREDEFSVIWWAHLTQAEGEKGELGQPDADGIYRHSTLSRRTKVMKIKVLRKSYLFGDEDAKRLSDYGAIGSRKSDMALNTQNLPEAAVTKPRNIQKLPALVGQQAMTNL